jgi:CheY-like chemotaxis protein/HPt (histidine-containing phosphotransfer) domain-containing protein
MIREFLTTLGISMARDAAAQGHSPKTIVVVDDDSDSPSRLRLALASEAYRVETAQAAETANLSTCRPDLIFLDPQVRAPDGTRLACRLLANRQLLRVPVIALTEETTPSREAFDGQIEEPIDTGELKDLVRHLLGPAARGRASQLPGLLLPHATGANRRKRVVGLLKAIEAGLPDSQFAPAVRAGLEVLADDVGGLPESGMADYLPQLQQLWGATTVRARSRFRSLLRLCREVADREPDVSPALAGLRVNYVEHRLTELVGLEHALLNRDYAALRRAAHNLKGMGAAYGFAELTDIGRALSPAAKDADDPAIQVLLDQIAAYLSIVRSIPEHEEDYAARS